MAPKIFFALPVAGSFVLPSSGNDNSPCKMKHLLCALLFLSLSAVSFSQSSKIKPDKYPSLLWEIRGNGLQKPSYLFGTMHVSSKMVFNLSDSFYLGIQNAQVVALETNPGTWQEDFSRYDLEGENLRYAERYRRALGGYGAMPQDYLTMNSLKLSSYERLMEAALYSSPSILNNFLYRSRSEVSADFEEDTYLDLHIFQAGRKLGKKICGVEDFDGSMQLVKEAYADAAREKSKKERSYDLDEGLSYRNMEEAYRTGNLDLLDTINKANSQSDAFDEKFLYKRNDIQARSIDSILKKGVSLFVGVGAAHLPGERGVIEWLRRAGYTLRPIKMRERDSRHKDAIEKIRVPVQFSKQIATDGFYSVNVPGKLYSFGTSAGADMQQYADMTNGSYYMVSRLFTNAAVLGQSEAQVERKIDSVLYENIPGKILSKKAITKNGYRGFEIVNRTRRGDVQRYNIFVTPFEIIILKMSGNGDYVQLGTEATQFFSSIQLKEPAAAGWKKYTPSYGGFEADLPHEPMVFNTDNRVYAAYDAATKTAVEVVRTDVHNYNFLEEDAFDLSLMEESFASSEFIQRKLWQQSASAGGYPALDAKYKFKDSSVALVRFLLNGPHYYTLIAKGATENKSMAAFVQSFRIKPFAYGEAKAESDTALFYTVKTPVVLEKKKKLSMYPDDGFYGNDKANDDDSLVDNGRYESRTVASDSTGEKIFVSFYKPSAYYYNNGRTEADDSAAFAKDWVYRKKQVDTLADKTVVTNLELGSKNSSRMLKMKSVERAGLAYQLQTELDTLSAPSAFVTAFFESFQPVDTVKGVDVEKKKTDLFFAQFFSSDTLLHKTAVKNIGSVAMDSTDLEPLKKSIATLSWKEKSYLDIKKALIGKLADMPSADATDLLRELYFAAGDTVELQYTALETLLLQQTVYAYKTFAGILETDPPVLDVDASSTSYSSRRRFPSRSVDMYSPDDGLDYGDGSFIDNLTDSLQLTAGIYKNLLPLITLNDYEEPIMNLTATLLDSSLLNASVYEAYLPKFIIEAKQLLKKQVIKEKSKAIEKAAQDDEETAKDYNRYSRNDGDYGNSRLSQYATLLLPFWEKNPQVPQIINRMLASNDKRLKYNTALLLVRNKKSLSDTLLSYFAGLDEYRYELYADLYALKELQRFPAAFKKQELIARSQVYDEQSYSQPDTVAFVQRVPVTHKERSGYVYVFKYKEAKADNAWKLATVGLLPKDTTAYFFSDKEIGSARATDYDFTSVSNTRLTTDVPVDEQVQKAIKRLLYGKRKSGAQFYSDEDRYNEMDFLRRR